MCLEKIYGSCILVFNDINRKLREILTKFMVELNQKYLRRVVQ